MILTLTIKCVWGAYFKNECVRVIEIDENENLFDLHSAIQDAVGFGRDHPYEFFLANNPTPGAGRQFLTENEEWEVKEDKFFQTKLKSIWPTGRKKLYYL